MLCELSRDAVARLRDRFLEVGYTVEGVHALLGPIAHSALHRNETTPGLRVTDRDTSPLATMVRLWLLQASLPWDQVAVALPNLLEPLLEAEILHAYGRQVCALVDVRPYGVMGEPSTTGAPAIVGPTSPAGEAQAGDHGTADLPSGPPAGDPPGVGGGSHDTGRDWWVVADLTPGMDGARPDVRPDFVLGVNNAATTLAQLVVRRPVPRALDLGTGSGIQALHLAEHASHIVATDVNPRALAMARLTAGLAGIDVATSDEPGRLELRAGDLFQPFESTGETFDLIVSNPPFVISPRGGLIYRDGGLGGDELCRRIVTEAPRYLTEGGICQILANWLHIRGEDWRDRLQTWLARTGCDAWVVQREVSDPAEYVEVWLKDAGWHGAPGYQERYDEWLTWLEAQDVEAIGYGWITLQRPGSGPAAGPPSAVEAALGAVAGARTPGPRRIRLEEWTGPVVQPLAGEVTRWLDTVDWLRRHDDEALLETRLLVGTGIDQVQVGRPGASDPDYVMLQQNLNMCRTARVDTAEAGFVGACDGSMSVGQIIDALATLLEEEPTALRQRLLPRIRELLEEGYVVPA